MAAERPIIIAYDGSPPARAAVRRAADLFAGHAAIVVTVWSPIGDAASAGRVALPDDVIEVGSDRLDRSARDDAAGVAADGARLAHDSGLSDARPCTRASGDNVWSSVNELAEEEDAAVVVAGSRGRSGISATLLGSVSSGLVHHAVRPVLIVPPDEGASRGAEAGEGS